MRINNKFRRDFKRKVVVGVGRCVWDDGRDLRQTGLETVGDGRLLINI